MHAQMNRAKQLTEAKNIGSSSGNIDTQSFSCIQFRIMLFLDGVSNLGGSLGDTSSANRELRL
jgi:hypothetical protein